MHSLLSFESSKLLDFQLLKRYSLLVALITLLLTDICLAKLKIKRLSIPRLVENGTEDSIVLDCIYTLDRVEDSSLVVKWFLNDDPEPIYQFIAEYGTRHASSRLKGRINLNYTVDSDPFHKYRALNLLRPTVDLSGRYSCQVQSIHSQDVKDDTMIVYATPKDIEFSYKPVTRKEFSAALRKHKNKDILTDDFYSNDERQYSSSSSELQCKVNNVFPLPELIIYRVAQDGTRPRTLDIYHKEFNQTANGAYTASVSVFIDDRELIQKYGNEPSIFECLVFFNEINHERRKRIEYFPVNEEIGNLSADSKLNYTALAIVFSFIFLCFKLNMNEL